MAFFTFALTTIAFIFIVYQLYHCRRNKLPPGPFPWPIIGSLHSLKPVRCSCFAEWSQAYGPILSVWLGSTLNVIVSSPELAREVLKDNDQHLADRHRTTTLASEITKDGKDLIWADYGPHYVKLRKVCVLELFAPKSLEALRPIREDEVNAMVESIYQESKIDNQGNQGLVLRKHVGAVALNVITRLAFGKRFAAYGSKIDHYMQEFQAILTNEGKLGASLAMAEHIPNYLQWILRLDKSAFIDHESRKDHLIREILDECSSNGGGTEKPHFADALVRLEGEYELKRETIDGLLWNMINAGADTTAIAVEWAMAELIRNPRVSKKAQAEIDSAIGGNRVMKEADIVKLPYLQSVVKEALRLHPPTPLMLPHRARADVKIGGYDVPKGAIVHVNVWGMGRDPKIWGDAAEFRPERFVEEEVDVRGHDFRLVPFGSGRRMCPAAQLGLNLVAAMVGRLLQQFRWTAVEKIDMAESPGLVCYMRTPLRAAAAPRLPEQFYTKLVVNK